MNSSVISASENIDQALRLNRELSNRIANLKRKSNIVEPTIEYQQWSDSKHNYSHCSKVQSWRGEYDKEMSCRLNIQGLTIELFLAGRTVITESQLIVILINKLKYPNQFSARRTARLIFQLTAYDVDQKRQIEDILIEFKKRLDCSSYSRYTGKQVITHQTQLFQKTGLKIRNRLYHKIMNKKLVNYHMVNQVLSSQNLDVYQSNQLLSYILQSSPSSSFHSLQLKHMLIKQQDSGKKNIYQKKQSILTKSSDDKDRQLQIFDIKDQISFDDCQIQIIQEQHESHKCGIFQC